MGLVFYSFCAISIVLIAGTLSPFQIPPRQTLSLDPIEIQNTSNDDENTLGSRLATQKFKPYNFAAPSFIPYITLGLGIFSALLTMNFYWQKPVHFDDLTTSELVDVLLEREDAVKEIRRRWDSPMKQSFAGGITNWIGGNTLSKQELQKRLIEKEKRLGFEIEQRLEVCKKFSHYRREAILAKKELKQLQERRSNADAESFAASL